MSYLNDIHYYDFLNTNDNNIHRAEILNIFDWKPLYIEFEKNIDISYILSVKIMRGGYSCVTLCDAINLICTSHLNILHIDWNFISNDFIPVAQYHRQEVDVCLKNSDNIPKKIALECDGKTNYMNKQIIVNKYCTVDTKKSKHSVDFFYEPVVLRHVTFYVLSKAKLVEFEYGIKLVTTDKKKYPHSAHNEYMWNENDKKIGWMMDRIVEKKNGYFIYKFENLLGFQTINHLNSSAGIMLHHYDCTMTYKDENGEINGDIIFINKMIDAIVSFNGMSSAYIVE